MKLNDKTLISQQFHRVRIHQNKEYLHTSREPTVEPFIWFQNTILHLGPVREMTGVVMSAVWPNSPFELSANKYQPSTVYLFRKKDINLLKDNI